MWAGASSLIRSAAFRACSRRTCVCRACDAGDARPCAAELRDLDPVTFAGPLPDVVLTWRLDGMSLFFAIVIVAIAAVTTLYAVGHRAHQPGFPGSGVLYALFVVAM